MISIQNVPREPDLHLGQDLWNRLLTEFIPGNGEHQLGEFLGIRVVLDPSLGPDEWRLVAQ